MMLQRKFDFNQLLHKLVDMVPNQWVTGVANALEEIKSEYED